MVDEHFGINIVEFMVRVSLAVSLQVTDNGEICPRYIGGGPHSGSTRVRRADDGYCNTVQRITDWCVPAPFWFSQLPSAGEALQ